MGHLLVLLISLFLGSVRRVSIFLWEFGFGLLVIVVFSVSVFSDVSVFVLMLVLSFPLTLQLHQGRAKSGLVEGQPSGEAKARW